MGGGTASDVAGETAPTCGPLSFDISNVSEYRILELYVHVQPTLNEFITNYSIGVRILKIKLI